MPFLKTSGHILFARCISLKSFWIIGIWLLISGCDIFKGPAVPLYCEVDYGQSVAKAWEFKDTCYIENGLFNPGITRHTWWVKTKVYNPSDKPVSFILLPNNPHINLMNVYLNGADTPLYKMGDFYPFYTRPLPDRDLAIPLHIAPRDSAQVMLWIDKSGETLLLESELLDEKGLVKKRHDENIFMGFIMGWMAMICVFAIFFWRELKQVSALFYAGYILVIMFWLISHWGIGFEYLWPGKTEWATKSRPVFNLLSNALFLAVVLRFFPPISGTKYLSRCMHVLVVLQLMLATALIMLSITQIGITVKMLFLYFTAFISLSMVVLIIFYLWKQWLAGIALVGFYFTGIGFLLLITILLHLDQSALQIGLPALLYNFASAIGLMGETTFITLGFARKASSYKSEKEILSVQLLQQEKKLAEQIIEMQEQTLQNISEEIHDNIGQKLGLLKLQLHQVQSHNSEVDLLNMKTIISDVIFDLRTMSKTLHPDRISAVPLWESIEQELQMVDKIGGIEVQAKIDRTEDLPIAIKVILFRVFQELIHNALKHAGATQICVSLLHEENLLRLIVRDNGVGIDVNAVHGIGLTSMCNRLATMGGTLTLNNAIEKGTLAEAIIPIRVIEMPDKEYGD